MHSGSLFRRSVLIGGVTVVSVLLVTACGSGSPVDDGSTRNSLREPSVNPTGSPEANPSEEVTSASSPELPVRPEALEQNDLDSAVESAQYFFELYEYSLLAMDTRRFEALSADECLFCQNFIQNLSDVAKQGHAYQGGAFNLSDPITTPEESKSGRAEVYFYLDQEEAVVLSSDDVVVEEYPPESLAARIDLEYHKGSWRVTGVVGETQPE